MAPLPLPPMFHVKHAPIPAGHAPAPSSLFPRSKKLLHSRHFIPINKEF